MIVYRCLYRGKDGRLHHKDVAAHKAESVRRQMVLDRRVQHVVAVYPVNPYLPIQPSEPDR